MSRSLERPFRSSIPEEALSALQQGSLRYSYRGIRLCKNPLDLALYTQLVYELRPRMIIEIGTLEGGSALWLAVLLTTYGIDGHVFSVDRTSSPKVSDPPNTFLEGDALAHEKALPAEMMQSLGSPRLAIDDSAHRYESTLAALFFFHDHLSPGDYVVAEDVRVNDLPDARYREYEDGPNRASTLVP